MRSARWRPAALISLLGLIAAVPACDKSEKKKPASEPPPAPVTETPAERTTAQPRPAAETDHQPIFFEVKRDGATNYFLGTMHLGFDYLELSPVVWSSLGASTKLAVETDIMKAAPKQLAASQLPEGQSLRTLLGDEVWNKLLAELGDLVPKQLERMQPWFVASLLLARLHPVVLPMDLAVIREAEKRRIPVVFLEPIELQLDLLPKVMNAEAVGELLDPQSEMRVQLAVSVEAYQKGDFDGLMRAVLDPAGYGGDPAILGPFLFDRNAAWIDKLSPMMAEGGVFVAVGAAHLGGEKGLIAGFEKQGYTVTRVTR